uniref:Capsid protein n=1 Tax=viral metagenome TaxID=1070528 RepID=A0A6C0I3L4_9ZZZZ
MNNSNIPLNNAAQCNSFLRSIIGLPGGTPGHAGNPTPVTALPAPPTQAQQQKDRFNRNFNFCRPVIYGVLDAVTQMGENNVPMQNLINTILTPTDPGIYTEFNRFYDVIFRPYTNCRLRATHNGNLYAQILERVIGRLLVRVNNVNPPQYKCGPKVVVGGGEAVNSFTMYKYHSLRTNDLDTKITHRPYYGEDGPGNAVGNLRIWDHSSRVTYTDLMATGINFTDLPADNMTPLTTTQRLFTFTCFVYFLLEKTLNKFYIHQNAGTANLRGLAAEYRLGYNARLIDINNNRFGVQSYISDCPANQQQLDLDWNRVFDGTIQVSQVCCRSSMNSVMRIRMEANGEARDAIFESTVVSYHWCHAAGGDLGCYQFLNPVLNQCAAHAWNTGHPANKRWVNNEASHAANNMYTTLTFNPMLRRPGPIGDTPPTLFDPAVVFTMDPNQMHPNWVNFLSTEKKINMPTLAWLICDQFRMIMYSQYLTVKNPAVPNKMLRYKQKISYLFGTLGLTYINESILFICQGFRIQENHDHPSIGAYLGGKPTETKKIESQERFIVDDSEEEEEPRDMNANSSFNYLEENDPIIESDDVADSIEGEPDRFDTLTSLERKDALEFSKVLLKKAQSLGNEKMEEYLSSFKAKNDIEFYGYLNYLSFGNPDLKDYRIGLVSLDSNPTKTYSLKRMKKTPSAETRRKK